MRFCNSLTLHPQNLLGLLFVNSTTTTGLADESKDPAPCNLVVVMIVILVVLSVDFGRASRTVNPEEPKS